MPTFRSSHLKCSIKKAVLKMFAIFHRRARVLESFFNKVAGLRPATLLKKRLQHRCLSMRIAKFLRTPIFKNICKQLFLYFRILKNKFFLKNEKMANSKPGKIGNLRKIIPNFPISEFSILPYSQNRKPGFKDLWKKILGFSRFPRFPGFRPGQI